MSGRTRRPTRPTRPVPRSEPERARNPRLGDELRVLLHLHASNAPVVLRDLERSFPDRPNAILEIVERLQGDGLVDSYHERDFGRIVVLTSEGRRVCAML